MMTPKRIAWLIFGLCALLVVDGLGWVTWQMVRLERRELEASREAELNDKVRLALWRMDSAVTPILAAESARPYFQYRAFYPADRAYTRMWESVTPGELMLPSPLLVDSGRYIRLHFEVAPDGSITSPQAPGGNMRDLAESRDLAAPDRVDLAQSLVYELELMTARDGPIERAIERAEEGPASEGEDRADAARSPGLASGAQPDREFTARREAAQRASQQAEQARADLQVNKPDGKSQYVTLTPQSSSAEGAQLSAALEQPQAQTGFIGLIEADASNENAAGPIDPRAAGRVPQEAQTDDLLALDAEKEGLNLRFDQVPDAPTKDAELWSGERFRTMTSTLESAEIADDAPEVVQDPFEPVWRSDPASGAAELFFVRRVHIEGEEVVQGFWIDWPALRADLLAGVMDLLAGAELEPIPDAQTISIANGASDSGRLLASIPARLLPTHLPLAGGAPATATRVTLIVTWLAVLVAITAIGVVLRTAMALSERRGRFVSAVTHELRTPMTTFCLYSQMLADGMVRDEQKKRDYIDTLKGESQRLARIVENVLAYARLDRRRATRVRESMPLGEMLDQVLPGLEKRAAHAGMSLELVVPPETRSVRVPSEREGIERILTNLVDNSCKYAAGSEDPTIRLAVRRSGRRVHLRVSDRGPGVPAELRRVIFRSFQRGTHAGDVSNPGLGLGLSLSRGLARRIGGALRLAAPGERGASFVLTLPVMA
ncbi:MAG: HAMP domain-containing histidine kinase [Phycisphaeraceae bacterium]|nr:HAMP domain-containing histidine kinase [Phycisphaeraceae bacterium]